MYAPTCENSCMSVMSCVSKPRAIASCKLSKLVVYFFFFCPFARVLSTPLGDAAVLKAPLLRNWPTRREQEFCKEMDEVQQRILTEITIKESKTVSSEDMEKPIQYGLTKDASDERVWL